MERQVRQEMLLSSEQIQLHLGAVGYLTLAMVFNFQKGTLPQNPQFSVIHIGWGDLPTH